MTIWDILGIVAIISLLITLKIGRNAIWGSLTIGAIGGLIYCLVTDFAWPLYKKILIISILAGLVSEIIGRLAFAIKKKSLETSIRKKIEKEIDDKYRY